MSFFMRKVFDYSKLIDRKFEKKSSITSDFSMNSKEDKNFFLNKRKKI